MNIKNEIKKFAILGSAILAFAPLGAPAGAQAAAAEQPVQVVAQQAANATELLELERNSWDNTIPYIANMYIRQQYVPTTAGYGKANVKNSEDQAGVDLVQRLLYTILGKTAQRGGIPGVFASSIIDNAGNIAATVVNSKTSNRYSQNSATNDEKIMTFTQVTTTTWQSKVDQSILLAENDINQVPYEGLGTQQALKRISMITTAVTEYLNNLSEYAKRTLKEVYTTKRMIKPDGQMNMPSFIDPVNDFKIAVRKPAVGAPSKKPVEKAPEKAPAKTRVMPQAPKAQGFRPPSKTPPPKAARHAASGESLKDVIYGFYGIPPARQKVPAK